MGAGEPIGVVYLSVNKRWNSPPLPSFNGEELESSTQWNR